MKVDLTEIVRNQSSREGARIHGLVLHTTEGSDHPQGMEDLKGLAVEFNNPSSEASAHYGVNIEGRIAQYVKDSAKAWSVCNLNPVTLNLEQVGFAAFSKDEWFKRDRQLRSSAEFLAYGHIHYGVPLRRGKCAGSSIIEAGIFQHKDFGIMGSGHVDCGDGYPEGYVILLAKYFIANKLHPTAPYTNHLRKRLNSIHHVHNLAPLG